MRLNQDPILKKFSTLIYAGFCYDKQFIRKFQDKAFGAAKFSVNLRRQFFIGSGPDVGSSQPVPKLTNVPPTDSSRTKFLEQSHCMEEFLLCMKATFSVDKLGKISTSLNPIFFCKEQINQKNKIAELRKREKSSMFSTRKVSRFQCFNVNMFFF